MFQSIVSTRCSIFLIANCDADPPHRARLGTATKQALEIIRRFLT